MHLANLELPQEVRITPGQRTAVEPPGISTTARQAQNLTRQALTDTLVARYQAGETVKALAAEFNMHHRTVKARLEDAGVEIRVRERKLSDRQVTKCVELYESGWSTARIGAKFGVSHNTVRRHLRYRGVTMRPMGRPPSQGA